MQTRIQSGGRDMQVAANGGAATVLQLFSDQTARLMKEWIIYLLLLLFTV